MKPTKQNIFDLVAKTKASATRIQELKSLPSRSYDQVSELDSLLHKTSKMNKELKSALDQFTESERNEMREEFARMERV